MAQEDFGQTLFSGSPFIFWSLAPFIVAAAFVFPWTVEYETPVRVGLVAVLEATALLLLLSLWPYCELVWARRGLCGLVFFAYAVYLAQEWVPGGVLPGVSSDQRWEALAGMLVFGLPSLFYCLAPPGREPG